MVTLLLPTKLHPPPIRPNLVARLRLLTQLRESLTKSLTLVSAPAGFGKTTLVSYLTHMTRVAWLSLDRDDNDPGRLLIHLIAALQPLKPDIGQSVLPLLESSEPISPKAALTILIGELTTLSEPFVLLLDDYHAITTQSIHQAISYLVDHLPKMMHVVITTRADPPFPLSRLRARDQLVEIRADELRFTHEETADFLNRVMGLTLTRQHITALEKQTEGWVVGLQLAALSMRDRANTTEFIQGFSGSHRYILDYLIEEVLDHQPEPIREFLLCSSILHRLNPELCEAVFRPFLPHLQPQSVLEHLERHNLFLVPLDDRRYWYRYHHLFADALHVRLKQANPDLESILHRRASEWFEQKGFIAEAVRHGLSAGDTEYVADLIERHVEAMLNRGEFTPLLTWTDSLPATTLQRHPVLNLARASAFTAVHQLPAAEACIQQAESALAALPADEVKTNLVGQAHVLRATIALYHHDLPRTMTLAQQALTILPVSNLRLRGETLRHLGLAYLWAGGLTAAHEALTQAAQLCEVAGDLNGALMALFNVAANLFGQGQYHQAEAGYHQALQLAAQYHAEQMPIVGWIHADLSSLLHERNELEQAVYRARQALAYAERADAPRLKTVSYFYLAEALHAQGNDVAAWKALHNAQELVRRYQLPPRFSTPIIYSQVQFWLAEGRIADAIAWAKRSGLHPEDEMPFEQEASYMALARVLLAQGSSESALVLIRRIRGMLEATGRRASVPKLWLLEALAFQFQGKIAQAMAALTEALQQAEPEGYVRTFIEEGEPIRILLERARDENSPFKSYICQLLTTLESSPHRPSPFSPHSLLDPLTERELQVLRLIAAGASNAEIAERLVITVNTVKRHVNHIFSKFNATSRIQAVARAREAGLV